MPFYIPNFCKSWDIGCEMNFTYLDLNVLNSKRLIQLGPDD